VAPIQSDHRELHDVLPIRAVFAARSRSVAAMSLSLSLKIADPATSTSVPAATASGAVVTSIPPSIGHLLAQGEIGGEDRRSGFHRITRHVSPLNLR
jgi:hypothetical protein